MRAMSLSSAKARAEERIIRSSSVSHDSRSSGSSQLNSAGMAAEALRAACDTGISCDRALRKRVPYLLSNHPRQADGGTKRERTQPNRVSSIVRESWRKRGHSTENQGQGAER